MLAIADGATDDAQVGMHTLAITASDESDATVAHTVVLTVENVAEAPTVTDAAPTSSNPLTAMEGEAMTWDASAWFADPTWVIL